MDELEVGTLNVDKVSVDSFLSKEELKVGAKGLSGSAGVSDAKDNLGKEKDERAEAAKSSASLEPNAEKEPQSKTWSQVVNDVPGKVKINLAYLPPTQGSRVVTPSDDILRKGNDKFKFTIVGSLTRGIVSYTKVCKFARTMWEGKGLLNVSQKDARTFHFKFDSLASRNNALSRGTWYLDRQPMVMLAWGSSVGLVKSLPLWVKFEHVPDCYWTEEGLSSLASTIGPSLEVDELTSKLEKSISKVLVSYPTKPLICNGCKSLGHLVGACPKSTRKWVRKEQQVNSATTVENTDTKNSADETEQGDINLPGITSEKVEPDTKVHNRDDDIWHTVVNREHKAPASDSASLEESPVPKMAIHEVSRDPVSPNLSPSPAATFKNLKVVDEIDTKRAAMGGSKIRLTKSQKKRARKAQEGTPPNLSTFMVFDFFGFLETHVKERDAEYISRNLADRFTWVFNYNYHSNGRIWLGWDSTIWKVMVHSVSVQQISCTVTKLNTGDSFAWSCIYGLNIYHERRELWAELLNFGNLMEKNTHWCLSGDFNVCLGPQETNKGTRWTRGMLDFRDFMVQMGLSDLSCSGPELTWWDSNKADPCFKKLDRCIVNGDWLVKYSMSKALVLPRGLSDHCPITVSIGLASTRLRKPFQFFLHLVDDPNFLQVVQEAWLEEVTGDPWFILTMKIKKVRVFVG
ncbi:uncharacterized protein LOC141665679 [Apium graveolens]|uniref:uncharacterized protein LOC141665679 n=1 Tax=Apium graveolens TaxID=4045 RepID=UPI003D7A6A7F